MPPTAVMPKAKWRLAACWAHARRKFFAARDLHPGPINWVLNQIRNLYQIVDPAQAQIAFSIENVRNVMFRVRGNRGIESLRGLLDESQLSHHNKRFTWT